MMRVARVALEGQEQCALEHNGGYYRVDLLDEILSAPYPSELAPVASLFHRRVFGLALLALDEHAAALDEGAMLEDTRIAPTAHLLPPSPCWLVWWKKDGLPRGTFADCELAWTSFKRPALVYNSRWHGFIRDSRENKVPHPTQKALDVIKWCVEEFSTPGQTILDPFLGSGTTAVAAAALGRDCIGIERDPEYVAIAQQRLAKLVDSSPLPLNL